MRGWHCQLTLRVTGLDLHGDCVLLLLPANTACGIATGSVNEAGDEVPASGRRLHLLGRMLLLTLEAQLVGLHCRADMNPAVAHR